MTDEKRKKIALIILLRKNIRDYQNHIQYQYYNVEFPAITALSTIVGMTMPNLSTNKSIQSINNKIKSATSLNRRSAQHSSQQDMLLVRSDGFCAVPPKLTTFWFERYFAGTVLQFNRESFVDGDAWQDPITKNASTTMTVPKNQYDFGHAVDGCQSLRVSYMAQFIVLCRNIWQYILKPQHRSVASRERFLI